MQQNQRLTIELRNAIVTKALHHTFEKDRKTLEVAKTELADRIYDAHYGSQESQAAALGERWVDIDDSLSVAHRGWSNGDFTLSRPRPQPRGWGSPEALIIQEHNPMYSEVLKLERRFDKLAEREVELSTKLSALLRPLTTVKKLLIEWPEGAKFIPSYTAPMPVVAATLTHEINRMMGLEPIPNLAKDAIVKVSTV
jgi:hypothetical protein